MKLKFLISVALGWTLVYASPLRAQCPMDTVDRGICDTMSVELLDFSAPTPTEPFYWVRVPIYVTHDLVGSVDSIGGFAIPLRFSHTNPTKYCSLSSYWNKSALSGADLPRSVFRHLVDPSTGDTIYNRMLRLYEEHSWLAWGVRIVDVMTNSTNPNDNYFRLALFPVDYQNRWWWEGEKTLLATMTFKIEDSMTIRLDTAFWPPKSHLNFWRIDSKGYVPRFNLPFCMDINTQRPMCSAFCGVPGDADWDGIADMSDLIYMIHYLFMDGPPPLYCDCADVDCDGIIDIADVVYYINYALKNGPSLRSCIDCY